MFTFRPFFKYILLFFGTYLLHYPLYWTIPQKNCVNLSWKIKLWWQWVMAKLTSTLFVPFWQFRVVEKAELLLTRKSALDARAWKLIYIGYTCSEISSYWPAMLINYNNFHMSKIFYCRGKKHMYSHSMFKF